MTTLREAAQQALEAFEAFDSPVSIPAMDALRAALAEAEGGGNLPPPLSEPEEFNHGIGDDRYKVVRGAYWWHVLIGDSPTKRGKFHTQAGAEEMAALLRREFKNGAFVQHKAALAEPVQEPIPLNEGRLWQYSDGNIGVGTPAEPVQENKDA